MASKRSTPKGARRAQPSAKRAHGPEGTRRAWRLRGPIRPDWLLLGLLAASLAIRLWGIHDRLPDSSLGINVLDDTAIEETDRTTMGRAWLMWRGGTRTLDLNPHTGGWPALSFYLTLAIQFLYKAAYSLVSGGVTAVQFQQHVVNGSASLFLFARVVGALIGVITVYMTWRIATGLLGRAVGLVAGLLLAANTMHVLISQHVSDPNLLALLFVLLATAPMLRVVAGGTLRDSIRAGAMIGLAGACKYVPLVLSLPFALAHRAAKTSKGTGDRPRRAPFYKNRALWAGLLAIVVAGFIASPFLFIDWKRTLIDIAGQRKALFSDWVGQTVFPISLPTYLAQSLPHVMGWPAYLLGLAGMVLLWRRGRVTRTLVWIPLVTVLANGLLKNPQERYVLVALPFLHLGAGLTIVRAAEWIRARGARPAFALVAPSLLAAAAVAWPFPELATTRHQLSLPDSRHLSRRWIKENIDPQKATVVELYGPVFTDKERAMVIWPFFATQSQLARPAYHVEFLDGLEYHVASGEISRRFESEPEKYPVENAYYRRLRAMATAIWESDPKTTSGPHIVIRRLPRGVSTRAQRDSLFAAAMPEPTGVNRVELWCLDCSKLFERLGEYALAEEWARRGLKVGVASMDPQLRSALAVALLRQGQLDSAEVYSRLAVEGLPVSPTLRLYHGAVLQEMMRFEEAHAEFQRAFTMSGGDPRIRLNIAQALGQLGRFEEAVEELSRVPPGHPERGIALRDMGVLMINHLNRPADGLNALRESIRLDPNQPDAAQIRGHIARIEAARVGPSTKLGTEPPDPR